MAPGESVLPEIAGLLSTDEEAATRALSVANGPFLVFDFEQPEFGFRVETSPGRYVAAGWAHAADSVSGTPVRLRELAEAWVQKGEQALADVSGDYALIVWDIRQRRLIAARDPLGVGRLFYAVRDSCLFVSPFLQAIPTRAVIDEGWVATYLATRPQSPGRTIWADCSALPAGHYLSATSPARVQVASHWDATQHLGTTKAPLRAGGGDWIDAVQEFRHLFRVSVRDRVAGERPHAWVQLSGGVDSSSITAVAGQLCSEGLVPPLGGTLTLVDSAYRGSEVRSVEAVLQRWPTRNEQFVDFWPWAPSVDYPKLTDEPCPNFPLWALHGEMYGIVQAAGGSAVLTGVGPDHYLGGGRAALIADLLRSFNLREAARGTVREAARGQVCFWPSWLRQVVWPLLPARARQRKHDADLPDWIAPAIRRRARPAMIAPQRGRCHYDDHILAALALIPDGLELQIQLAGLRPVHPFLDRRLVEFCVGLPADYRTDIDRGVQKRILRAAMRDVLSDEVRTRTAAHSIHRRVIEGLNREWSAIDRLLDQSRLIDEGWVDADAYRAAVVRMKKQEEFGSLTWGALALDTWFAVRSGRWAAIQPLVHEAA